MATALTGSEKQVKWAEDIRAKFIEGCHAQMAFARDPKYAAMYEGVEGRYTTALRIAETITSAKWWIDNGRNVSSNFGRVISAVLEQETES